ncbi:cystinosin homolog [Oppia nitens]|uniref:cystinosin homolog n=1 Tax=Oppia nitens TaxID=1686743 RepID=UPI0023DC0110|nr:cystinosin homolog [Oppia nitens]XP_054161380.1 cystinosin homolog [Oppia nitens]
MFSLFKNYIYLLFIIYTLKSCFASNLNDLKSKYTLKTSVSDIAIEINEKTSFTLNISPSPTEIIELKISCEDPLTPSDYNNNKSNCYTINGFKIAYYIKPNEKTIDIEIKGAEPGKTTLIINTNINGTNVKDAFVRISVARHKSIDTIGVVIGWIYFLAWSVSFYPQMWINFRRKSVVGLNFDFLGLNITGFLFYTFFNVCLFFSSEIKDEFNERYPRSVLPVELNDVVFAIHAVFATSIVIIQCFIFERQTQTISIYIKTFLGIVWIVFAILAIIVPTTHWFNWLTYLYCFSYVKLAITIIKYIPQAWYNYKRQSTIGWSIENILLDFTGGSLSLLQMFLLAYNYNDWLTIFKNFTKFGLGMISILFDVLFIVQHYVLYRNAIESESTGLTSGINTSTSDLASIDTIETNG